MWRISKLLTNLVISSFIFNYFVSILVLLLNPLVSIKGTSFLILYFDLYVFYGPLWIIVLWLLFFLLQFFSEKKIDIGVFSPPTVSYFIFFSVFVSSLVIYLNYDYYFIQFSPTVKSAFIEIMLINLAILITGIFFVLSGFKGKRLVQVLIIVLLITNFFHSFIAVVVNRVEMKAPLYSLHFRQKAKVTPRKIRLVLMNGLSPRIIQLLKSEQNLLNFNHLIRNGVSGNVSLFKPNLDISLLNSALTGESPSKLPYHSNYKFKFRNIKKEFNIFPRYIFFRYSSNLKFTLFYKKNNEPVIDHIQKHYKKSGYKTQSLINPIYIPSFFSSKLKSNPKYIKHFSTELKKNKGGEKFHILNKAFFYDDYIKSRIIDLKDSDYMYSVIRFKGLNIISKYFYQYFMSHIFGNIDAGSVGSYNWVIKKYYEYYDSIVGNLISSTGDDELLVILSLYEYEPLPVWRRILANLLGDRDIYVYKSLNAKGSIFLYEKSAIKKDYPLQNLAIGDLFPTLLYYSRFNLSENFSGKVIREIFTEDFLLNNPIDIKTNTGIIDN